MAPANTALNNFAAQARTWTSSTSAAEAQAAAKSPVAALTAIKRGLKEDRWPARTQPDIKKLTKSIAPVAGDLSALDTIDSFNASTWISKFNIDVSELKSAVAVVRHDLGLPSAGS